ncbi:hypothetical protein DPMN_093311 [Dreissena polymorpha]|uniref:LRAT domain-containing protein n=1 Tax=Dreissena polymorpha TaxID=45954 RepID=A0A9D4L3A6_DREPO|nr:hypothetical protein DPMN_093311 [Dreissena polymorpha]
MQCSCGQTSFREYIDQSKKELIGVNCTPCGKEWLKGEYVTGNRDARIVFQSQELFHHENRLEQEQEVFQVRGNRTQLPGEDWKFLQPGDHITWHRPYIIWHHAIVVNVDMPGRRLQLIHYSKVKDAQTKYEIVKEWIKVDQQWGSLYRINYDQEVNKTNPSSLVLSRAHFKLGETKYSLFSNNCESMASFCKTGVSESCQVRWLWGKMKEIVKVVKAQMTTAAVKITFKETLSGAGKITLAEGVEQAFNQTDTLGNILVVAVEGGCMVWDISKMYEHRQDGGLSKKDFIESSAQRFMEALSAAGLAIVGSLSGAAIGAAIGSVIPVVGTAAGTAIGMFIGSVVLGTAGALGGRVLGSFLGTQLGKVITNFIKWDDKAVKNIREISTGDQIVFCPSFFHPRCHAIVVATDPGQKLLYVIRSTYMDGVVEDSIQFQEPIYKVIYREGDTYEPDVVISRARSKLGVNEYNILTNNCKDFAVWCKYKTS